MKVYKLFWTRLLGLLALVAMVFLVCLIPAPPPNEYLQYIGESSDGEASPGTQYVAKAVSFLGDLYKRVDIDALVTSKVVRYRTQRDTQSVDGKELEDEDGEADDIVVEEVEEEYNDEDNENRAFQKGDFDYKLDSNDTTPGNVPSEKKIFDKDQVNRTKGVARTRVVQSPVVGRVQFRVPVKLKLKKAARNITTKVKGLPVIEDGIFWSMELESKVPPGLTDSQVGKFLFDMRHLAVKSVEPPTWNRCGRPKNQFVTFEDGSQVCARYRTPHDYLVQGEVLSFYLSRLLALNHVPSVTLSAVDKGQQWKAPSVVQALKAADWQENATVALIQWIDGLERDRMPPLLLKALLEKTAISPRTPELANLKINQFLEILQWSSLIVFDYITGNYDRVASMQDAADKEKKPSILHETIHNLVTSRRTGSLWLIDNESGLLDSYTLLYGSPSGGGTSAPRERRFVTFHRDMLRTVCVFRRPVVERVQWLYHRGGQAANVLVDFAKRYERLYNRLPNVFDKNKDFVRNFHRRIAEVYQHIKSCRLL